MRWIAFFAPAAFILMIWMFDTGYVLLAVCVVIALLPPKWDDPAIRLKEWSERK